MLALCHRDEIHEIDQILGREAYFGFIAWLSSSIVCEPRMKQNMLGKRTVNCLPYEDL